MIFIMSSLDADHLMGMIALACDKVMPSPVLCPTGSGD
jgi:hypothetical protein